MGSGRVVLFPSPFRGHLNPMLHLASVLHATGRFSLVTVVHTVFNSPDASSHPDLEFVPMEVEGLDDGAGEDYMSFLITLNANCREPFARQMERMMLCRAGGEAVVCLIVDAHMYFTVEVAEKLKVPRFVFRTTSACSFRAFLAVSADDDAYAFLSIRDGEQEKQVPEMAPFRFKDLPEFSRSTPDSTRRVLSRLVASARASDGVIMNTFDALERLDLQRLQADLNLPVIPVGPLHKLSNNGREQDESCMDWLKQQPVMSVLYVSFGSLICMDMHELLEAACGLANSRQPFLWVVRPGSVRGAPSTVLTDLEEEMRERGRVVQWAPQLEVLRHSSVGGFWTHCGWNSVMESICEGVPMLCSPFFGDQLANARMVSHVWEVGIELGRAFERAVIECGVRRLMAQDEGREMRRKAMRLKAEADHVVCVQRGSSSRASMERLFTQLSPGF